jgi:hypothetical protein
LAFILEFGVLRSLGYILVACWWGFGGGYCGAMIDHFWSLGFRVHSRVWGFKGPSVIFSLLVGGVLVMVKVGPNRPFFGL